MSRIRKIKRSHYMSFLIERFLIISSILSLLFFSSSSFSMNKNEHSNFSPDRIVIVFVSGFQFSASSSLPQSKYRIRNYIGQDLEQLNLLDRSHVDNYSNELTNKVFNDLKMEAESPGMKNLRDLFEERLKLYNIPSDNIIYVEWTESDNKLPWNQPTYDKIVERINKLNPEYLAIIGHSYGGCTAVRISRETRKKPDFIGLIDPVFVPVLIHSEDINPDTINPYERNPLDPYDRNPNFPIRRTSSIPIPKHVLKSSSQESRNDNYPIGHQIINWYQENPNYIKGFHPIYDDNKQLVENILVEEVDHITIDDNVQIHEKILDIVVSKISPQQHM